LESPFHIQKRASGSTGESLEVYSRGRNKKILPKQGATAPQGQAVVSEITGSTTIEQLAAIVCDALSKSGIDAILVGGAVVSIYSKNEYLSFDLDFITHAYKKDINVAMQSIGFIPVGRHYTHPKTKLFVEFPSPPLAIGDERIESWATRRTKLGTIFLLAPTECVMDRLAAYFHWNDKQGLDQALVVASQNPVNLRRIKKWSIKESRGDEYSEFERLLKKKRSLKVMARSTNGGRKV
jgi:hypothetical protein